MLKEGYGDEDHNIQKYDQIISSLADTNHINITKGGNKGDWTISLKKA